MTNTIESTRNHISGFHTYLDELHKVLLDDNFLHSILSKDENLYHLLDGRATTALYQTVPLAMRKEQGIFFTNYALAEKISSNLSNLLTKGIKLADPACGAGSLLLACANYLPIGNSFEETIDIWSSLIFGCDLFEEFVSATKLRLMLLAAIRTKDAKSIKNIISKNEVFPGLRVKDILIGDDIAERVDCVVVNPPFGNMNAPDDCEWATGIVQKAGVFFEQIICSASEGQHVIAILPDVLRSGTRYGKWRRLITDLASSVTIELTGRFDKEADVDVFILNTIAGNGCSQVDWLRLDTSIEKPIKSISDYFNVHVGSVVPHRDSEDGPSYPYIHARTIPAWETVELIHERRKYKGTVFKPPFVVVHRTSSPRDRYRCVGTIINANTEVAVENHLIVLLPKNHSLEQCDELLRSLKNNDINKWMNSRICCRHLTVAAMKELPWRSN